MPETDPVGPRRPASQTVAAGAPGRLEVAAAPRRIAAMRALFPEFAVVPLGPGGGRPAGVAVWSGTPYRRARARAAAAGAAFLELGESVLHAPPGRGAVLGATALQATGTAPIADALSAERVLRARGWETPELLARARRVMRELVALRLGGRWWDLDRRALPERGASALLVLDEADAATAQAMLDAALAAHAACDILALGAGPAIARRAVAAGCMVVSGAVDRWEAIDRAGEVYVAGGETGFLALLAGRRLRCFAPAFYAGWGLSEDLPILPRRPFARGVDEIFAGAVLRATRHLDPFRLRPARFEELLEVVAAWKRTEAANREIAVLVGMSFWKRRHLAGFFRSAGGRPRFRRRAAAAVTAARARGGAVAVWASRIPPGLAERADRSGVPLIRVEDGFIRSVGLGSDFLPAASLAVDRRGMYYDPSRPSDLEMLLRETRFDARLVARAGRLIERLVARGVTKYNLGARSVAIAAPPGRRVILVPGQVEDDLSVRLGGGDVAGNLELLRRVRRDNCDAYILYKPHPDVEAGHRPGALPDAAVRAFADAVVHDVSIAALLLDIDELHTVTSLAGFEALLRRRPVTVYGRPFYAGWGLTRDIAAIERGRRLSLEELVAGALILYPRYLDPLTRLPCGPEIIIERFEDPALWRPGPLVVARRLQGALGRRWQRHAHRPAPATGPVA